MVNTCFGKGITIDFVQVNFAVVPFSALPGHDVISNTGLSVLYIVGRNGTTMYVFLIPYNNLSITIYHACKNQKVAIDPRIVLQPQTSWF